MYCMSVSENPVRGSRRQLYPFPTLIFEINFQPGRRSKEMPMISLLMGIIWHCQFPLHSCRKSSL
jgi:hypothetical protein